MRILNTRGDTNFWQWDTGRKLVILGDEDNCGEAHFCTGSGDPFPVAIRTEEGLRVVDVPDEVLQTARPFTVYLIRTEAGGDLTRHAQRFNVFPKTKPSDYIHTPSERQTWEQLDERIEALEQNGPGGVSEEQIAEAVSTYMAEHPIDPGVDEQEIRDIVDEYLAENLTPDAPDSGQNLELDTTLTQSGKAADAGAVGAALDKLAAKIPEGGGTDDYNDLDSKPSINGVTLVGNRTAEELGIGQPTNEQVSTAVNNYLTKHPVTPGATEDQAKTIQKMDNIGFSDPYAYGNLLDTATMILNSIGTPAAGKNVFDYTNWNPESPWQFFFFPVEAGATYTVCAQKLAKLTTPVAVARDGTVIGSTSVSFNPPYNTATDSENGVVYQQVKVPDTWSTEDGYFLLLQLTYGTGTTDFDTLMVFRGDYSAYQGYRPFDPDLGTTKTPRLRVDENNLTDEMLGMLNRGNTAIQTEDLVAQGFSWANMPFLFTPGYQEINAFSMMDAVRHLNTVRVSAADMRNKLRLGSTYAHCPTLRVIGNKAYVAAFQNAINTVDDFTKTTIELWIVDLDNWAVLEQINVASAGLPCGDDTLKIGGGDPNILNIDDTTLRIIFTTQLSDGVYRICYRDYDVTAGALGDIGLCKISNGTDTYDLNIEGIKAVCGAFTAANPVINMATQYATYNGDHYIGLGVGSIYSNIPILKTADFITFTYWATPSVEGNAAHYECALTAYTKHNKTTLMAATRQCVDFHADDSHRKMLITKISLDDGSVQSSSWIPDGLARPHWHNPNDNTFSQLYLWHINTRDRWCSTVTEIGAGYGNICDTYGMIYPSVATYDGGMIVSYMSKNALWITKIPRVPVYVHGKALAIMDKMLDYFTVE